MKLIIVSSLVQTWNLDVMEAFFAISEVEVVSPAYLHWLPVKARCQYKIAILAYRHFDVQTI